MSEPIRINIGAGPNPIPGYDNSFDASQGKKAFPLDIEDGTVDEIRASHIFEHFGHRSAKDVLTNWVAKLKPGGILKIAVPDFETIARKFLAGEPGQYQGWLSGGQTDLLDVHLAQYEWHGLCNLLRSCGLIAPHRWVGEGDCSQLDISLNIAAYKPIAKWPTVQSVLSRPRLGWQDHFGCVTEHLLPMGISVISRSGVYWGKCMTLAIEAAIDQGAEWILTLDYDTLFHRCDVEDLLGFMAANPEADALVPMQMGRTEKVLMNMEPPRQFNRYDTYVPIKTGHFGCTLFRTAAIQKTARPWFQHSYKEDGEHGYDEDINFWLQFEEAGNKAFLTPRVVVGHLEVFAMWPGRDMGMVYQRTSDWRDDGRPKECWR